MTADLRLSGKAQRTVYGYLRAVRNLSDHCELSPDQISQEQIRQYLLHQIVELEVASGTQSVILSGLKFFYSITCPRDWPVFKQTKLRRVKILPEVITQSQVQQIVDACNTLRLKTFVWTTYTLGLRISEAVNLQIGDVDGQRMMVHIHRGKGAKDRFIPLPASTLHRLRDYWRLHRHETFLFPATGRNHQSGQTATTPMSIGTIQGAVKKITNQLKFGKTVSTHTLRHSYASHLLEAGVSLKAIQKYLGHSSLKTTLVYLHLTETGEADARKVIDQLFVQDPFEVQSKQGPKPDRRRK